MSGNGGPTERDFAPDAYPPETHIADGLLQEPSKKSKRTKRRYTVRKDRPKRPLSAYNLFFRYERERVVRETLGGDENVEEKVKSGGRQTRGGKRAHRKTHGAIGFAELGKHISAAWKNMSEEERAPFQAEADKDKERYQRELSAMPQMPPAPPTPPTGYDRKTAREGGFASRGAALEHDNKEFGERHEMEEGQHQYPGYNVPHPYDYPPGHPPPPAYYDQRGYWGNNQMVAPSAFAPPHPHGSPGYAPPPRYPPRSPYEGNPQMQTAHAFAPPLPAHHYQNPNSPNYAFQPNDEGGDRRGEPVDDAESDPEEPMNYAFQCEVCGTAVFSTFQECADHEQECKGSNADDDAALKNKKSDEEEAHEQAVEAVMMLNMKKPIEC